MPRPVVEQTARHRGVLARSVRAHVSRDPTHERCVAGCLGGGDEQEELSRVVERPHLTKEVLLEPSADRKRLTDGATAPQLLIGQLGRQLEQCERTAARLDDDPLGELGVDVRADLGRQQLQGRVVGEPADGDRGQAGERS